MSTSTASVYFFVFRIRIIFVKKNVRYLILFRKIMLRSFLLFYWRQRCFPNPDIGVRMLATVVVDFYCSCCNGWCFAVLSDNWLAACPCCISWERRIRVRAQYYGGILWSARLNRPRCIIMKSLRSWCENFTKIFVDLQQVSIPEQTLVGQKGMI